MVEQRPRLIGQHVKGSDLQSRAIEHQSPDVERWSGTARPGCGGPPSEPHPEAWPEIPVPDGITIDCHAFGLAGHGRLVWAEGRDSAPLLLLLDNPGARETREGNPFVCGTRQTLRRALVDSGNDPDNVYVTFLTKCRPLRAYDKQRAWRIGLTYVIEQLRSLRPRVLVVFGDVVSRAVTGDPDNSVRILREKLLTVYGVPTIVTYHPLAARRRPNLYPLIADDLARAAKILRQAPC